MNLALTELRRRPARFSTALAILVLLAGLLQFLGALSRGLDENADLAFRRQDADLFVFSADADRSISQSTVSAATRRAIEQLPGAARVGGLQVVQLAARLPDRGPRDLLDVTVIGYDLGFGAVPDASALPAGAVYADTSLRDRGVRQGEIIRLGPARTPVTVAGFTARSGFLGQGTIWAPAGLARSIIAASKPDEVLPDGATQAVIVRLSSDARRSDVAALIDASNPTDTATKQQAVDGVDKIGGGVLNQIFVLTAAIATAVIALFFALLTNERLGLYGVLKAFGARTRTLALGITTQAITLSVIATGIATFAALTADRLMPRTAVPFVVTLDGTLTAAIALTVAAIAGSTFSLRRITRLDPAIAIGAAT